MENNLYIELHEYIRNKLYNICKENLNCDDNYHKGYIEALTDIDTYLYNKAMYKDDWDLK